MNNRMKKILCMIVACLMIVTVLSSCNKNKNNTSSTTAVTTTSANALTSVTTGSLLTTNINGTTNTTIAGKTQANVKNTTALNTTQGGGLSFSTVEDFRSISFDTATPSNLTLEQSWDCMGSDNNGIIYLGWTCMNKTYKLEDFAVFSYNPSNSTAKYIDTFINVSKTAKNWNQGEAIPKGHTKFINVGGKLFMGSQSFHDFKQGINDLSSFRGSHIYCYDPATNKITDLSASLANGVVTKNQGIVAMNYMPSRNLLVCLTHPYSDLVFFNIKTNKIERYVKGIPWVLGNPLSREVVVSGDKVYLYRGVEEGARRNEKFNVYTYDYKSGASSATKTSTTMYGGFWNGQATTKDGKKIYISTSCGELYVLETATGKFTHLTHMLPANAGQKINYVYSISMSADEKKLYYIPSMLSYDFSLYEYDIATGTVMPIYFLQKGIYTGNNVRDKNGYFYFAQFGTQGNDWTGECNLLALKIKS